MCGIRRCSPFAESACVRPSRDRSPRKLARAPLLTSHQKAGHTRAVADTARHSLSLCRVSFPTLSLSTILIVLVHILLSISIVHLRWPHRLSLTFDTRTATSLASSYSRACTLQRIQHFAVTLRKLSPDHWNRLSRSFCHYSREATSASASHD